MPTWRCPHCGAAQPESSRCWVCRRSTTCCSTCRHFRRAVAGGLGYCGLDRRRAPLAGDEIRGCWQAPREPRPADTARWAPPVGDVRGRRRRRQVAFVPVGEVTEREVAAVGSAAGPPALTEGARPPDGAANGNRHVLWEDLEA